MRARYGSSPLHLLAHLAVVAAIAWAAWHMLDPFGARSVDFLLWIVVGALAHDLLLLPAYSLVDRLARRATAGRGLRGVPVVNHLRFPAAVAGILLLVTLPLTLDRAPRSFERATGAAPGDRLGAWLLVCAGAFALSGLAYAVRVLRAGPRP